LLKRDLGEGTAIALFRFNLKYWDTLSQHDGP
jgi:hypothetical protein